MLWVMYTPSESSPDSNQIEFRFDVAELPKRQHLVYRNMFEYALQCPAYASETRFLR